jgi:hypothetical protein
MLRLALSVLVVLLGLASSLLCLSWSSVFHGVARGDYGGEDPGLYAPDVERSVAWYRYSGRLSLALAVVAPCLAAVALVLLWARWAR